MSAEQRLDRVLFETSRAAEYFSVTELQAQTGQPVERFADVVLKELLDNAVDACETGGVAPQVSIVVRRTDGTLHVEVQDNAAGLPPQTIARILNFQTRTSDKAAYRAPTRGAQGNALKTVLGMPCALGGDAPITIEACGMRHAIRAWIDPAGELRLTHDQVPAPGCVGTCVSVALPAAPLTASDPHHLARAVALFNPHVAVRIHLVGLSSMHADSAEEEIADSYQPTVAYPGIWRKFLPTDLTSPWWYDPDALARLIFAHIAEARRGGKDLTLREFVRQFRGLSGTAKAKAVCDQFPRLGRLSEMEQAPHLVGPLLAAMQRLTTAPSPAVLGLVGEDHYRARFAAWYGVKRFWYRSQSATIAGIPVVCECAVAETVGLGEAFYGLNFSPAYDDPLQGTPLRCAALDTEVHGLRGLLAAAHALPRRPWTGWGDATTAVAVHLVCPALAFMDRAKTRLSVPGEMADLVTRTVWRAASDLHREGERRRKDAVRATRAERARETASASSWSQKEVVFRVLPQAHERATGGGQYPVSARSLYYQVRRLMQAYTAQELDYDYFSQKLLVEYRERFGPLVGLYYDPRGVLYEPHTRGAIPLGTREVEAYSFPAWLYNKILYVEKKGLWPILQAARLAERYDMAIVAAEGYATEAARVLFAHADRAQSYQLFVLHDADPHGYNIARTLREETARMPDYSVDVIDLGLKLDEALAMGLPTEQFTRRKALPDGLELTEIERRHFTGRQTGRATWIAQRTELNAMTNPQLVAFIERRLAEVQAVGKVVPSDEALPELARAMYEAQVRGRVERAVRHILSVDAIANQAADELRARVPLDEARTWIGEGFAADATQSWRGALAQRLDSYLDQSADILAASMEAQLRAALLDEKQDQ